MSAAGFESTSVEKIPVDDEAETLKRTAEVLASFAKHKPEDVICMMSVVVHKNPDGKGHGVDCQMLGSDADIAKMLTTQIKVAREGIMRAVMPSNPTNETAH